MLYLCDFACQHNKEAFFCGEALKPIQSCGIECGVDLIENVSVFDKHLI